MNIKILLILIRRCLLSFLLFTCWMTPVFAQKTDGNGNIIETKEPDHPKGPDNFKDQKESNLSPADQKEETQIRQSLDLAPKVFLYLKEKASKQAENDSRCLDYQKLSQDDDFLEKLNQVSVNFLDFLKSLGINKIDKNNIPEESVINFVKELENIRTNRSEPQGQMKYVSLKIPPKKDLKFFYFLDDQNHIYFTQSGGVLDEGNFKTIYHIFSYPPLRKVVQAIPKDHSDKCISAFRYERLFVEQVQKLIPADRRRGIAPYIGTTPDAIFMEYLDGGNLQQIADTISPEQRMDLLLPYYIDLGHGMSTLHEHDLIISDVKPENMLASSELNSAFHIDFGLGFNARQFVTDLVLGKADFENTNGGSPRFMAPEQVDTEAMENVIQNLSLIPNTGKELAIQYLMKRDVFAFATSIATALKPEMVSWAGGKCRFQNDSNRVRYHQCKLNELKDLFRRQSEGAFQDKLSRLLLRGMEIDPLRRINAKSFILGLESYQELIKYPENPNPWGKDKFYTSMKKIGAPNFQRISLNKAKNLLLQGKDKPPHLAQQAQKYVLIPHEVSKGLFSQSDYYLEMVYLDAEGNAQSQILNVDVTNEKQIQAQANYLMALQGI